MLTVSDSAATEIRNLVAQPEVPDEGGVRIASSADGDAVVENGGARVFLDQAADELLDDKYLDAGLDPNGEVQFSLAQQRV